LIITVVGLFDKTTAAIINADEEKSPGIS